MEKKAWTIAACCMAALVGREVARARTVGLTPCTLSPDEMVRGEAAVHREVEFIGQTWQRASAESTATLEEVLKVMSSFKNLSAALEERRALDVEAVAKAESVARQALEESTKRAQERQESVAAAISDADEATAEARSAAKSVSERLRQSEESESESLKATTAKLEAMEKEVKAAQAKIEGTLESLRDAQTKQLDALTKTAVARAESAVRDAAASAAAPACESASVEQLKQLIDESARRYLEGDRVGDYDFALGAAGATVVKELTSPPYTPPENLLPSSFWHKLGRDAGVGPAEEAIAASLNYGSCFAFGGTHGNLTVRLARPVVPTAFSLEHIHGKLCDPVNNKNCSSAPRAFTVLGHPRIDDDVKSDDGVSTALVSLGAFQYDVASPLKPALQQFPATATDAAFEAITLAVNSNHGHPNYTCVYRFRVHGRPAEGDDQWIQTRADT